MEKITQSVGKKGKNLPADVETIQQMLNGIRVSDGGAAPPFFTVGTYSPQVDKAIIEFQTRWFPKHMVDGTVGPGGPTFRRMLELLHPEVQGGHFYLGKPPLLSQGSAALCWATALQSWLRIVVATRGEKRGVWHSENAKRQHFDGLPWHRRTMSLSEMRSQWGDLQNPDQSLTAEGIRIMCLDLGMDGDLFVPSGILDYEYFFDRLKKHGYLYMAYFSAVMYHAVVVYGVSRTDGIAVMDPAPGMGHIHRKVDFFLAPNRVGKTMLVAWAT